LLFWASGAKEKKGAYKTGLISDEWGKGPILHQTGRKGVPGERRYLLFKKGIKKTARGGSFILKSMGREEKGMGGGKREYP